MASSIPEGPLIYTVQRLSPQTPHFEVLAERFTALRLRALLTSPHAFAGTHAQESAWTPDEWRTRLSRSAVHTFVAVAHPFNTPTEEQTIENGALVGKVTLLGPLTKEIYELPKSGGPAPLEDGVESHWSMTSLYTEPEHRGHGLGKKIIIEAVGFASSYYDTAAGIQGNNAVANGLPTKPKQTRVRILIHPDNVVVVGMYESLGFVDAGRCTLAEAYISNGDAHLVPEGGGDPKEFHSRRGLIMELLKYGS